MWAALTLAGHSGTVRCLHLHNNRLVSGSSDRTIKVPQYISDSRLNNPQDHLSSLPRQLNSNNLLTSGLVCTTLCDVNLPFQVWDLATDKVGWVGAACRATMVGHMHTVRCLQVIAATMHSVDSSAAC